MTPKRSPNEVGKLIGSWSIQLLLLNPREGKINFQTFELQLLNFVGFSFKFLIKDELIGELSDQISATHQYP